MFYKKNGITLNCAVLSLAWLAEDWNFDLIFIQPNDVDGGYWWQITHLVRVSDNACKIMTKNVDIHYYLFTLYSIWTKCFWIQLDQHDQNENELVILNSHSVVHILIMWSLAIEWTLSYATPQYVGMLLTFHIIQVTWPFDVWK